MRYDIATVKRRRILSPSNAYFSQEASGAPDNPLEIFGGTDLIGWWDLHTGVTLSGSDITAIADQSGNGKTLTNSGTVPYDATGFNGGPCINFVATNNAALQNTSFTGFGTGTTFAVFIVGQMHTETENFARLCAFVGATGATDSSNLGSFAWNRTGTTNAIDLTYFGTPYAAQSISLATNYRLGIVGNGTHFTHYVNNTGGTPEAGGLTFQNTASILAIGIDIAAGALGSQVWDGQMAEIVILKIAPDSTQRDSLDDWFTYNWGL
jgi:hypothetical protein